MEKEQNIVKGNSGPSMASKIVYLLCILVAAVPMKELFGIDEIVTPALALFAGLVFAMIFPMPFPKFNKKGSKYLLQASVVGLGFGMNVTTALKSGAEGMLFTVVSVIGVMAFGVLLGYWMHLNRKTSYLIASGTAI